MDHSHPTTHRYILAYTYGGAMHLWSRELNHDSDQWQPHLTVKGHFNHVTDIDWDKQNKQCLLSCSADQTSRILTKCSLPGDPTNCGYFEISRP